MNEREVDFEKEIAEILNDAIVNYLSAKVVFLKAVEEAVKEARKVSKANEK